MEENKENIMTGPVYKEKAEEFSVEAVKINRGNVWETVSAYIFIAVCFLAPIFVLPYTALPIETSKAYLVFIGIAAAAIFWLISFIQNGEIIVPKSSVLLSFLVLTVLFLFTSILSENRSLSLIGDGWGIDSFGATALLSMAAILAGFLFQKRKSVSLFFNSLFVSGAVLFIFQFFKIVFNFNLVPSAVLTTKLSNLLGSWNEFGIFFGFSALLASIFLKFSDFRGKKKIFLVLFLILSLLAVAVVNFKTVWLTLAAFSLVILIYIFSSSKDTRSFASLPLLLFVVSVLFVFLSPIIGNLLTSTNLNYIEVRPSWAGTFDIIKSSLSANPFFGSGPGTFQYDWLLYKPQTINLTQFWLTRFNYGIGFIPSLFATGGILLTVFWVLFFVFFLKQFLRIISSAREEENKDNFLLLASFFGSLYLWVFSVIYTPSFVLLVLAFIVSGVFVAQLSRAGKIRVWKISFLSDPKIKFVVSICVLAVIIASLGIFYTFSKKYASAYYFVSGAEVFNKEGNIAAAENYIVKGIAFDRQDRHFRALTELGLLKMQQILNNTTVSPDELRASFQSTLTSTIQAAQTAVQLNNLDPLNYASLAKVYEAVAPFKIEGAAGLAVQNYKLASARDPMNPDYFIALARLYVQQNSLDEAKSALNTAIELKPDYAVPNFMLAQVEASMGNINEAIKKTTDTYFLAPNDIGVLFQLGLLYYQNQDFNNSRFAFEKAVSLNENYSNARYFLGLIYDKQGRRDDALREFEKIESLNSDNQEVKSILKNLERGKPALEQIAPPAALPEKRTNPPISPVQNQSELRR